MGSRSEPGRGPSLSLSSVGLAGLSGLLFTSHICGTPGIFLDYLQHTTGPISISQKGKWRF